MKVEFLRYHDLVLMSSQIVSRFQWKLHVVEGGIDRGIHSAEVIVVVR